MSLLILSVLWEERRDKELPARPQLEVLSQKSQGVALGWSLLSLARWRISWMKGVLQTQPPGADMGC